MTIATFFEDIEDDAQTEILKLELLFTSDVWPFAKQFLSLLLSQTGKVALSAAVASLPLLATGGFAAAGAQIGAAVVASLPVDVPMDVAATLASVQAALQVVKASTTTVTTGDASQVAAIQAAAPNPASPASTQTGAGS